MATPGTRLFHAIVVVGASIGAAACSSGGVPVDSGPAIDSPIAVDSGSDALAMNDTGGTDAGPRDLGGTDTGVADAAHPDSGPQDSGVDGFVAIL